MHLTKDKWRGGQFGNKPESWREIASLFPAGAIEFQVHNKAGIPDAEWIAYLRAKGINAELYCYADHPGQFESRERLDIAPYLRSVPALRADVCDIALPERFFTAQWDSNQARRTIDQGKRDKVIHAYRADGFQPVIVGGLATQKHLGWSLKHIAYAMSKAAFHVGCDSAFMHLAMLYMPMNRIHLYNEPDGFYSHHALRARDNGAVINLHL